MHTTIYDVAKKAKVSIATVSRAINQETRKKVAPETAQQIDDLIKKLCYTPNAAARNLCKSEFKSVGVVIPHHPGIFREDYYSKVLSGIADALLDADYHLKTVMLKCNKKWDNYNFKLGEGVDGLIVTHWHAFFRNKVALENLGLPVVVLSDVEKNVRAHYVSGNHFEGGRLVAQYLYSQGHRNIGVLSGPPDSIDSRLRLEGFDSFLKAETGKVLDPSLISCGHFQEEKGGAAFEDLISRNKNITAIFCLNDNMAFGAIKKMNELGIKCPEQISVVGYDDEKRGESFSPALTTVHVPIYDVAKEASEKLLGLLTGASKKTDFYYKQTLLPVKLIVRNSVRKI